MSSDNACLVRQPRVRVLKQIVASHRGFVCSLDGTGAPEGSLGSGPSSDSLAIADVENQDRMQFSSCAHANQQHITYATNLDELRYFSLRYAGPTGENSVQESPVPTL